MSFKLIYFFCILNAGAVFAQALHPLDSWQSVLRVQDKDGTSLNLTFGKAAGATGGLDGWLGEQELPPYPPSGVFDARFLYEAPYAGYTSLTDIRGATLTQSKWSTRVQQGQSGYQMLYSWDPSTLPPVGSFLLQDAVGGLVFSINMRSSSSYTVTNSALNNVLIISTGLNAADDKTIVMPSRCRLLQNYPNPFNPSTAIPYELPTQEFVNITVYNSLGTPVRELLSQTQTAGLHVVYFNASGLASGIYYCRMAAMGKMAYMRMLHLK
ncbi:MAG: T9SS type A sorting domain-containing protein [Ignavibacteriales bacterium]|nr:T9SS type A sorting domain-containing protein [Ignavibacteriales bacterium]